MNEYTGCVDWFNKSKGYGFIINLQNNERVFVHHSSIHTTVPCYKQLFHGEYVNFTIICGKNGTQVGKITGILGGKLLCESIHNHKKNGIRSMSPIQKT